MDQITDNRFRTRLSQTLAWLNNAKPLTISNGLVRRSSDLLVDEEFAADHPQAALEEIAAGRERLLVEAGMACQPSSRRPSGGRVLLLLTERNLKDGSAQGPSKGLIGEFNVPPCDCRIDFFESLDLPDGGKEPALASWIPEQLVALAQRAIDVNPEECLVWGDESALPFDD